MTPDETEKFNRHQRTEWFWRDVDDWAQLIWFALGLIVIVGTLVRGAPDDASDDADPPYSRSMQS